MLTPQTPSPGPEVERIHQAQIFGNEPPLPSIHSPISSDHEAQIIEQFRLHHKLEGHNLNDNPPDDENEVRRRISYTREQKLVAIDYATTTWKQGKDGNPKLISKYAAAANLGITTAMLRNWIQMKARIESLPKGTRKESGGGPCQEPELEKRLLELFKEARLAGRKTNKPWFVREGKRLYGEMYPHRVIKVAGKMNEYRGFKFSDGWFEGFRRRAGVTSRNLTKKAEQLNEEAELLRQLSMPDILHTSTPLPSTPHTSIPHTSIPHTSTPHTSTPHISTPQPAGMEMI